MKALPTPAAGPVRAEGHAHRRYPFEIVLLDCTLSPDYLCLQYSVTPVPEPLIGDLGLHEGDAPAVAIDSRRRVYRDSTSAYRLAHDGTHLVGAVRLGPATWPTFGLIRILFSPLAHTPPVDDLLCEARVILDGDRVRGARLHR
jgi:hypothetical protein